MYIYEILEQQQNNFVRIPVNYTNSDSSTPDFIEFEPKTYQYRACIDCKHLTIVSLSSGLCNDCDYNRKHPLPRHGKSDLSSTNLIDFEQKTDQVRPCIVCKRYFYDLTSTGLCSDCNYNKNSVIHRPAIQLRALPTVNHTTIYRNSDFLTPISIMSRVKGPQKITCPRCRNLNLLNGITTGTHRCSVCQSILHVPRY